MAVAAVGSTGVVVSAGIVYHRVETAVMVRMVLDRSDVAAGLVKGIFTGYVLSCKPIGHPPSVIRR